LLPAAAKTGRIGIQLRRTLQKTYKTPLPGRDAGHYCKKVATGLCAGQPGLVNAN
jgi:hypothetical protein